MEGRFFRAFGAGRASTTLKLVPAPLGIDPIKPAYNACRPDG